MMEDLIRLLHEGGHSLVVSNGRVRTFDGRGVADLYGLLNGDPEFLSGAVVADKVVGKAAAALMILGGVGAVHADVLSRPALELFVAAGVEPAFDRLVDHIINRTKTGWCPLESRCRDCRRRRSATGRSKPLSKRTAIDGLKRFVPTAGRSAIRLRCQGRKVLLNICWQGSPDTVWNSLPDAVKHAPAA